MAEAIGMEGDNNTIPITVKVQTLGGDLTPIQEIETPSHIMSPYMNPAAMGLGVHEVTMMYPDTSVVRAYEAEHGEIPSPLRGMNSSHVHIDVSAFQNATIEETQLGIGRGLTSPIIIGDHNIDEFIGQDMLEELHNGNLNVGIPMNGVPDVTLGGFDASTYNGEGVPAKTPFVQARELMASAILDDPSLHITYQSMVAMHLSDRYGMTDHDTRNECASELLEIIFRGK
jgi:hypothetical protein